MRVSSALMSCGFVKAAPPAVANLWQSSIWQKISAIGKWGGTGVVSLVVLACNALGLIHPYDWYRWRKISWSVLTPNPSVSEWIPARYDVSTAFSSIVFRRFLVV